jgi:hypothetical protein
MAYKKFDDPTLGVDNSVRKIGSAAGLQSDPIRRALQSINNRVLWGAGTDGYNNTAWSKNCGTGAGTGCCIGKALVVLINGAAATRGSCGTVNVPTGTQSANTFVKYGLFGGDGSSGTCFAGNEAATAALAKLPDCPDGLICFGYMLYATTSGTAWARGTAIVSGVAAASACGTATFVDLWQMPYDG